MSHEAHVPILTVDAFADEPFSGNPAAVCLLAEPAEKPWMQAVAREMNLSETAFLVPRPEGFELRWFTPATEVDLCGHATLASAHVLWETGIAARGEPIRFQTRSGILGARPADGRIALDFPATPAREAELPAGLVEALGVVPVWAGRTAATDWLVEVEEEGTVHALAPDYPRLATIPARGVIVTSRSVDRRFDFVSRFFAPRVGIDEDPVTGSAHCALAPYWSRRLERSVMTGFQASARGGVVHVRDLGKRVELEGRAVTILRGELMI
ncbi:MAG: PhzF family phenazine biosynthesis protein [Gemmatimonadota bacterium]